MSEIRLQRRSIPGQIRYLAAKLREGEQHRDAVALALDVMAEGVTEAPQDDRLAKLERWLHARQMHPDFEYATTSGPRKGWDDADRPPEGDGWERNTDYGNGGWERFDYHEESHWRRPRAEGAL